MKYRGIIYRRHCILININMRCIEMGSSVLLNMCLCQININMRCIEMNIARAKAIEQEKININMRCIEILT